MGDKIKVYSKDDIFGKKERKITVNGQVKRPGVYKLHSNLKLKDLLFQAVGLSDSIFSKTDTFDRANIKRISKNKFNDTIIPFDINDILNDKVDLELQDGDVISIFPKDLMKMSGSIRINGDVKSPGDYDYDDNMSLLDLILKSGGFNKNTYAFEVEIARIIPNSNNVKNRIDLVKLINYSFINNKNIYDISNHLNQKALDVKLKPHDLIQIRSSDYFNEAITVNISGAVNYPGDYALRSLSDKINTIIERAGGLTDNAYPFASSFVRDGKKINLSFERIIKNLDLS